MIILPVSIFFGGLFLWLIFLVMVTKERRRGRRFFAVRFRGWLDRVVEYHENKLDKIWGHFVKYILQLNWYYSIHSILKTVLKCTVSFYTYFENVFESNRSRTKKLRAEKKQVDRQNHLVQMAEHKQETALTPAQKKSLRKKSLEGK